MLDGQPETVLAECARQHKRVMRGAVFTGILLAVLLAATVFAAATERYHGPIVLLAPVLFVLNGMQLLRHAAGMYKIRNAERLIRQAQPRLPASLRTGRAPHWPRSALASPPDDHGEWAIHHTLLWSPAQSP